MDVTSTLTAIAAKDRAAFTRLYSGLQPKMERYAAGILAGDVQAAADVVDEAFMDIWRNAGAYDGSGHPEGWIRRIVRNKAIDWVRKQKEKVGVTEADQASYDAQADDGDNPEQAYEKKSDGDELRAAMERLSSEHREVLWLCYFENMSVSEIASAVDCPENTVKTRLFHGRKQLRLIIERRQSEAGASP